MTQNQGEPRPAAKASELEPQFSRQLLPPERVSSRTLSTHVFPARKSLLFLIEKGLKLPPTPITEKVASKPEVCSFPLEGMQPSKVVGREFSFTQTSGSWLAGMQPPSDRNQDPVWNPG